MKSRRWRDGAFLKKEKERCFIVDLLGRTARGSRLNILFFGKIYEIPPLAGQSCYKKMKADWLSVNNEQRTPAMPATQ